MIIFWKLPLLIIGGAIFGDVADLVKINMIATENFNCIWKSIFLY